MTINLSTISKYYSDKLKTYGDSPKGVDWKNKESQILRFRMFDSLFVNDKAFSIMDYGCGKGDYSVYLGKEFKTKKINYYGVDISESMIDFCKKKIGEDNGHHFYKSEQDFKIKIDYIIASGTFTVKHGFTQKEWYKYVIKEIDKLYKKSKKGIGFNVMTSYVDFKESHLFYMDPSEMLRFLIKKYRYVDIIHSYPLYEYTILIRKNGMD